MSSDLDRSPTLAGLLDGFIEDHLERLHTWLPGRVESYDDATGRATVQPLIKRAYVDETGERQVERLPSIPGVPVVFPGSGGRRIKWDVLAGDVVILLFCEASIDRWLALGREVDPADDRRHSLSDAIAIPGLLATQSEASPQIVFSGSEIHAGGSASLATKADIDAIKAAIQSATTSANDGGALLQTTILAGWPASVGTSVLKGG